MDMEVLVYGYQHVYEVVGHRYQPNCQNKVLNITDR